MDFYLNEIYNQPSLFPWCSVIKKKSLENILSKTQ